MIEVVAALRILIGKVGWKTEKQYYDTKEKDSVYFLNPYEYKNNTLLVISIITL